jgi:hypothetical protein
MALSFLVGAGCKRHKSALYFPRFLTSYTLTVCRPHKDTRSKQAGRCNQRNIKGTCMEPWQVVGQGTAASAGAMQSNGLQLENRGRLDKQLQTFEASPLCLHA